MARHQDLQNPSDISGLMGSGALTYGIVVDINDPQKLGRVRVRRMDQDKSRVPDDKLPWIHCGYNNQPSLFGMGSSPPNYQCGSKVLMLSEGMQGYTVLMSVPNAEKTDQRQDIHEDAKQEPHRAVFQNSEKFKKYTQDHKTTDDALRILNTELEEWKKNLKEHKENIDEAPTPPHYNKRPAAKDKEGEFPTVATSLFQIPRNPQKFIKGIVGDQSSVVKTSLDMLENLKEAAMKPLQAPMPTPAVGAENIMNALQGLAALFNEQLEEEQPQQFKHEGIASLYAFEDGDTLTGAAE